MTWWRRKHDRAPTLDEELTNSADGPVLSALMLVRKRLGLGIEDAFARLREHPAWADSTLVHELSDRRDERVLQTATLDGIVVLKEYCHDESSFDPPEEDDYEYFEYELELDGRTYEVRNYCDDDEASIRRSEAIVRDGDAQRIARLLIEREGVRRVTRMSRRTGAYTRIVALGPGWSLYDPSVLLALRDGPVRVRDLRAVMTEDDDVPPEELELASSRPRLAAAGLVVEEGDRLALTDAGRRMVDDASGGAPGHEWIRLWQAVEQLPLPESGG